MAPSLDGELIAFRLNLYGSAGKTDDVQPLFRTVIQNPEDIVQISSKSSTTFFFWHKVDLRCYLHVA